MSNSGGTLTLPSPTHAHHVDVQAGLRTLRRSLSRSPSKFSLVRTASQSSSEAGSTPSSPSCRRVQSQYFGQSANNTNSPTANPPHTQSPLATPFRPSVKLSLRSSAKKSPAAKPFTRNRTSPKSPARRALNTATSTSGNSAPTPADHAASGQENNGAFRGTRSPAQRKSSDKMANRHSMHLDISGSSSQFTMSRLTEANNTPNPSSVASPLKRSDATMSLDQTLSGSPKAKRRSYGPSNYGGDFNVFDHGPNSPSPEIQDDSHREYDWTGSLTGSSQTRAFDSAPSPTPSAMPRRAGSLRKSTLQQRHGSERTSWGRRQAAQQLAQAQAHAHAQASASQETSTPAAKNRPRLSLDHFMPPPPRESPFNQGPLPNPSAHLFTQPHQPHPLSRTMTTSSSGSSMDDSPTHFPTISERPRAPMNWSKSLPLGAQRPQPDRPGQSISTPDYKHAKPFEGAFASTGLVSKVNRNPEQLSLGGGGGFAVPDTPCKKQSVFATYPPQPPSGGGRSRGRHARQAFGVPATPFEPASIKSQRTFGEQPRPVLFNGFGARHARKGSLLSLHSDDGRSPLDAAGDTSMNVEGDLPPTPTKQQLSTSNNDSALLNNDSPTANRQMPAPLSIFSNRARWDLDAGAGCKYTTPRNGPLDLSLDSAEEAAVPASSHFSDPVEEDAPTRSLSFSSFYRTRARRSSFSTPRPLENANPSLFKSTSRVHFTKSISVVPASPLDRFEFADKAAPRTPLETVAPLDASRLSISQQGGGFFPSINEPKSTFPPATPTTRTEVPSLEHNRRTMTPINGNSRPDLDESLMSRFGRVEFVGKGEFSSVFKVAECPKPAAPAQRGFFSTPTHRTPPSPFPENVYAVKKLALPFQGDKDRSSRLREVAALQALKGRDHVLQLIDSWEDKGCLYIQTEYCEEGSLDSFLAEVGTVGRLDEFRIWKIMLEICKGLQHIHDADYVHLDLKPANILINFEGTLQIGDFGLAASLPVEKGFELEGDRQYLAPEALRSEINKAADIFSLGLIMLEIAGNVDLPDNGASWTALREGDFSEFPPLTVDTTSVLRDATGTPVEESDRGLGNVASETSAKNARRAYNFRSNRHTGDIFGLSRRNELQQPPDFMCNPENPSSLNAIVKWMLSSEPSHRPTISQLLELESLKWVAARQRAGATVFEGNWGPADEPEPVSLDTEMTDV